MEEQHLIIDWTNAFSESQMLKYIAHAGLKFNEVIQMQKLANKVKTITKFYSVGFKVDDERGATDFKIYMVTSPVHYDYRNTTKGKRLVNTNLYDLKMLLRKKANSQVHATDNIQETKDNLKVFGLYEKHYNRREFSNISEVFDTLNALEDFKYVIMRNFEGIPDDITIDEHLDVDLLVSNYYMAKCALDATTVITHRKSIENGGCRILNSVLIDGNEVWFDLRYLGDNYYDIELEKRMLNDRISRKNFYVPDTDTHKYTLIYHALIHKPKISKTYRKIFRKIGLDTSRENLRCVLDEYMKTNSFEYVKPNDKSVRFNK
mgnify:CR=1 FL=1|jgi:hypothetical protein